MNANHYTTSIEVEATPQNVFQCITAVSSWWSKDFKGNSQALNDEFIIDHGEPHFSKQKLVEVIPGKKMVWLVVESRLNWLQGNQQEWTNTRMIFELNAIGNKTIVRFTHEGLLPEKESYIRCREGWNMVIGEKLLNFIKNETA